MASWDDVTAEQNMAAHGGIASYRGRVAVVHGDNGRSVVHMTEEPQCIEIHCARHH